MYFIMSLILYSIEHTSYWFPVLGDGIIAVANIGSRLTKEKEWEWEQETDSATTLQSLLLVLDIIWSHLKDQPTGTPGMDSLDKTSLGTRPEGLSPVGQWSLSVGSNANPVDWVPGLNKEGKRSEQECPSRLAFLDDEYGVTVLPSSHCYNSLP